MEAASQPLTVVDDLEVGPVGHGEVLVDVAHCGLCHSDLHLLDGTMPFPVPAVLGHEAGGVVAEVGPGVEGLAPGDTVMLTARPPCRRCYYCVRGQPSLCAESPEVATGMLHDGTTRLSHRGRLVYRGVGLAGLAGQVVVRATGAIKVPDDTPTSVVAIAGCAVQTGVGAVLNTARVEPGATVLVVGLGGIGVSVAQGARLAGASRVIGVDPLAERRSLATSRFGVTDAVDPAEEDVVGAVMELTGGIGVDYGFEAVGKVPLIQSVLDATRAGGTTVLVGVTSIEATLTLSPLFFTVAEKRLLGCFLGSCDPARDLPRIVDLWRAGRLDLDSMVTRVRPLAEVNDGFADLASGVGLRTVIDLHA